MTDADTADPDEIADNFREYVDALTAEIEMSQALIEGLEGRQVDAETLPDAMPDMTPMERWNADNWRDRPDSYDHLPTLGDHDEKDDDADED